MDQVLRNLKGFLRGINAHATSDTSTALKKNQYIPLTVLRVGEDEDEDEDEGCWTGQR